MNTDESVRLKLNIVLISKISVSEKFYTHDHEMILQFLKLLKNIVFFTFTLEKIKRALNTDSIFDRPCHDQAYHYYILK